MRKVRWGILGAGNIAHRFAKALSFVDNAELYAIAARKKEKGLLFAEEFPCEKIYQDYDEFLNDPLIDCVYLALPHGLHYEYSLKALNNKKYVLCEKPATINLKQMIDISECAKENDTFFMEAMKQRFVPIYSLIKEEVLKLGKIESVTAKFCRIEKESSPDSYYFKKDEGGCLLDTGIYCASWLDDFSKGEFELIYKDSHLLKGVDNYNKAILKTSDIELVLENGKETTEPINCWIKGENGYIEVINQHRPIEFTVYLNNQKPYTIKKEYDHDDFYSEINHVNEAFIKNIKESDIMPLSASIRCAEIIELIKKGEVTPVL